MATTPKESSGGTSPRGDNALDLIAGPGQAKQPDEVKVRKHGLAKAQPDMRELPTEDPANLGTGEELEKGIYSDLSDEEKSTYDKLDAEGKAAFMKNRAGGLKASGARGPAGGPADKLGKNGIKDDLNVGLGGARKGPSDLLATQEGPLPHANEANEPNYAEANPRALGGPDGARRANDPAGDDDFQRLKQAGIKAGPTSTSDGGRLSSQVRKDFDPDQPRDESGKWSGGGSSDQIAAHVSKEGFTPRRTSSGVEMVKGARSHGEIPYGATHERAVEITAKAHASHARMVANKPTTPNTHEVKLHQNQAVRERYQKNFNEGGEGYNPHDPRYQLQSKKHDSLLVDVCRYDSGALARPEVLDNGWMRLEAHLTRSGIFEYKQPDGTVRREYRPADEVFNEKSLSTFRMVPVTDDHPPCGFLDSSNVKLYQVGQLGDAVGRDGDRVRAALMVTDPMLVTRLQNGHPGQLSCGYHCDLELTSGQFNGEKYDAIQRNIRGNHVAVVETGRAGPEARMRLDSADATMLTSVGTEQAFTSEALVANKVLRIDGVDFEVTEQAAQAVAKLQAERETARADLEKLQARADSLAENLQKAESARKAAEDPKRVASLVAARVSLERTAKEILGDVKVDSMSAADIKLAVIAKASPDFKAEGRSPEYLQARFDTALETLEAGKTRAIDKVREVIVEGEKKTDAVPTEDAYDKMVREQREYWKSPPKDANGTPAIRWATANS